MGNSQTNAQTANSDLTIGILANTHPEIIDELRRLDRTATLESFAALLTLPSLQANCYRIEALILLAAAYCDGRNKPSPAFIRRSFERIGKGDCGRMEDPSEDLFVATVSNSAGTFRVFEGIREANCFSVQRIVNIIDTMPTAGRFAAIRESALSLLKLSDKVIERMNLPENSLGEEFPRAKLPKGTTTRLPSLRSSLRFNNTELRALGVSVASLNPFAFGESDASKLSNQSLTNTELDRKPLLLSDEYVRLVLPTAVGPAITRFVIDSILSIGMANAFERALVGEFATLFSETLLFGGPVAPAPPFARLANCWIGSMMTKVDPGRFLQVIFVVDCLAEYPSTGLGTVDLTTDDLSKAVASHLNKAAKAAFAEPEFRDGITAVIICGYGRALKFTFAGALPDKWRLRLQSSYDFVVLSWLSTFKPLSLWRLLDAQQAIQKQGVTLVNPSGLLNLVAWSTQLKGHLVPHGKLPDGFVRTDGQAFVLVPSNAVRELRYEVALEWAPRRVLDPDGHWARVRKLGRSHFAEDNGAPFYASEDDLQNGRLRGVYTASRRNWWIEVRADEDASRDEVFQHWNLLYGWLQRAAPVLDDAYPMLPKRPLVFLVAFHELPATTDQPATSKRADELRQLVKITLGQDRVQIRIDFEAGFADGLAQPENTAERIIVEAFVNGAAEAAGEVGNEELRSSLANRICPGTEARRMHRFAAQSFRDFVRPAISPEPVLVDPMDDAACRIGLGWRLRSRDEVPEISGMHECTRYLNDIVQAALNEFCTELKAINRRRLVLAVLQNYEKAGNDRDLWRRTTQALLATHNDKDATIRTILRRQGELNGCFLASRLLIEAAVCECPPDAGKTPGQLELSRLMASILMVHHLGGWSDAIRWQAMEPRIRITPLGDVHMDHSFMNNVFEPFGRVGAVANVNHAVMSYGDLYAPSKTVPTVVDVFESQFLEAWRAEFGVSLDGLRAFIDRLEDVALDLLTAVHELPRSNVVSMLSIVAKVSAAEASETLSKLTLEPRETWRAVSGRLKEKDWYPWRFRRRLSFLRRPLIQVDSAPDPAIMFAPASVREALHSMVGWFHSGEIPSSQANSREMCQWIGHANNVQRTKFNSTVAARMRDLGWQVRQETKLTAILGKSLDRDYGDIDVLAWQPDSGRVLVIECKDVQHSKAIGEVAEQLADFRGEQGPNGKPDHLKRHLNRMEVLTNHRDTVSKILRLSVPVRLECHLVFKNPVPMRFAWEHMASRVQLSLFDELDSL